MPEGPFGLDRPFSSPEPFADSILSDVYKVFDNIPEWSKSAKGCTDFILNNFYEELSHMSNITRDEDVEVTRAICFDGDTANITRLEKGSGNTAPSVSCNGGVRLADIHTHPVSKSAYPSLSDTNSSLPTVTGLPTEFNIVVIRPERNTNKEEALGTCLNLYSMDSRCDIHKVNEIFRSGNTLEAQKMVENELISNHGATFSI